MLSTQLQRTALRNRAAAQPVPLLASRRLLLRDGQVLCALANALEPGAYAVKPTKLPFKQMENISAFCRWAKAHGVPGGFETVDLFEAKDMVLVLQTLLNLGIKAGGISKGA